MGQISGVQDINDEQEKAALQADVVLVNRHGLHARPAALLAQTAAGFDAMVQVSNLDLDRGPVAARGLLALTLLGAVKGHTLRLSVQGAQAHEALAALQRLIANGFGEIDRSLSQPETGDQEPFIEHLGSSKEILIAIPASAGYATAPLAHFHAEFQELKTDAAESAYELPGLEWQLLLHAIEKTRAAIHTRRAGLVPRLDREHVRLFDAHLLALDDPDLLAEAHKAIYEHGASAAAAWRRTLLRLSEQISSLSDDYLRRRASDMLDVIWQVDAWLLNKKKGRIITFDHPVILCALELTPTKVAQLDVEKVLGIVTVGGSAASHYAVLARALEIPMLTGAGVDILSLPDGVVLGLDGVEGCLYIDPSPAHIEMLAHKRQHWLAHRRQPDRPISGAPENQV